LGSFFIVALSLPFLKVGKLLGVSTYLFFLKRLRFPLDNGDRDVFPSLFFFFPPPPPPPLFLVTSLFDLSLDILWLATFSPRRIEKGESPSRSLCFCGLIAGPPLVQPAFSPGGRPSLLFPSLPSRVISSSDPMLLTSRFTPSFLPLGVLLVYPFPPPAVPEGWCLYALRPCPGVSSLPPRPPFFDDSFRLHHQK